MPSRTLHRPPRRQPPPLDADEVSLPEPPREQEPQSTTQSAVQVLIPVVGAAGSMVFMLANPRPITIAAGSVFLFAAITVGVALFVVQRGLPKRRLARDRARYLDFLERLRDRMRQARAQQIAVEWYRHPDPAALLDVAGDDTRVWERRPEDDDFLVVRLGLGDATPALVVERPSSRDPLQRPDAVCESSIRQLLAAQRLVPDVPITIDLRRVGVLSICGDTRAGRGLARALLAQLATWHSPDDLTIAVCVSPRHRDEWTAAKWLPHSVWDRGADGPLPQRLVAESPTALRHLLSADLEQRLSAATQRERGAAAESRHLVIVVDDESAAGMAFDLGDPSIRPQTARVTVIHLVGVQRLEPGHVDLRLRVSAGGVSIEDPSGPPSPPSPSAAVRADALTPPQLEALARDLAPYGVDSAADSDALRADMGLPDLVGITDIESFDPLERWADLTPRSFLRAAIGVGEDGLPLVLDLKESALGGMGPHGLVVGATGSGKSELLRTLVTSLAVTHPPDRLAFVLVDFKGGAAFAGLDPLPHVAGMITNLQDDLALVDRMKDALYGEMRRRQEQLKAAGNLPNLHVYHRRQDAGEDLPALPSLVVIVDEFSELLTAKPEFAELFVAIGRIGRSIGIHLLLSSQRLETGRIRGLESHLSYRIGLKTFSAAESRDVIGVADAYELPPVPGSGFLRVDTSVFRRFKAAYVSAPYRSDGDRRDVPAASAHPLPYTLYNGVGDLLDSAKPASVGAPDDGAARAPTQLDILVSRIHPVHAQVHQVWVPPLAARVPIDAVLRLLTDRRPLGVPVGIVDLPDQQRVEPLVLDLADAASSLAIVGAPQTGKTTALRSLILAGALTQTPRELAFYCVDYGGGGLRALEELPHVGAVAGRFDPERVQRTLAEIYTLLVRREELYRRLGIDSAGQLRRLVADGELPGEPAADIVLVIDSWAALRQELPDAEALVTELASRGLGYGLHVVVTANRWSEIRPALANALRGRIELRIGDSFESRVDRKSQDRLVSAPVGRGLTADGKFVQIALPRLDGHDGIEDLPEALTEAVAHVQERSGGVSVPRVRVLPHQLGVAQLAPSGEPGVPFGMRAGDLGTASLDLFGTDPHFVVFGDSESGKTAFLRTLVRGLVATHTVDELLLAVVDYRRSLLGEVPDPYLAAYVGSPTGAESVLEEVASAVRNRLPGPDVSPEDLRARTWWRGPEVVVVVDDYDLVTTRSGLNPLEPLEDLLPHARDIGLHVVVARRAAGASRATYEPVLQRLLEVGSPGLLLSGSRGEGALLHGVPPGPQPNGRGVFVRRGMQPELVQLAWTPPAYEAATGAEPAAVEPAAVEPG